MATVSKVNKENDNFVGVCVTEIQNYRHQPSLGTALLSKSHNTQRTEKVAKLHFPQRHPFSKQAKISSSSILRTWLSSTTNTTTRGTEFSSVHTSIAVKKKTRRQLILNQTDLMWEEKVSKHLIKQKEKACFFEQRKLKVILKQDSVQTQPLLR